MNTLDRTDKIDDFLLGKMSDEEKNEFERLLSGGDTSLDSKQLKQEMELQEDIILAIKERGLKEMLQTEEAKIQAGKAAAANYNSRIMQILSPIAIAACLFGFIIYGPQTRNLEQMSQSPSYLTEANMEITTAYQDLRGCEDIATSIMIANDLMQNGSYVEANQVLSESLKELKGVTPDDKQAWAEKEDIVYLQALCAIQRHKVYRSRALLTKVISMDGIHKQQATELLEQIKHGK